MLETELAKVRPEDEEQLLRSDSSGDFADSDEESEEDEGCWSTPRSCCVLVFIALPIVFAVWYFWSRTSVLLPKGYCDEAAAEMPALTPSIVAGLPNDAAIEAWASKLVGEMTDDEKLRLVRGVGYGKPWGDNDYAAAPGFYIGNTLAVPRLGIPSLRMQDAAQGFRTADPRQFGEVTAWPCSLAVAAGWDPEAVERWARAMGEEFRTKGANVALGPSVNVHRVATNGRNAEYLSGEDPALGAPLVAAYVRGMQGAGVAAVVKHFVLNQQETHRQRSGSVPAVDAIASERTLWEEYYPPFQAAVEAGVAAVMCSYNHVNGYQACQNAQTLTSDLKSSMGFTGWVMSDWWALESASAAEAGTDQEMPGNLGYFGALRPSRRLDDMAGRVLRGMAQAGLWGNGSGTSASCRVPCDCGPLLYEAQAATPEHVALARELAATSAVLLKNEAVNSYEVPAVPRERVLAAAESVGAETGGVSDASATQRPQRVLPFRAGQKVAVVGSACNQRRDPAKQLPHWTEGDYYVVGGSGRVLSKHPVTIVEGLQGRGLNLELSLTDDVERATNVMAQADVALVCGGATSTESVDRNSLSLDQESFISTLLESPIADKVPVVVLALLPGAIVAPWSDRAAAVVAMFLSGQETGNAAADVLFGDVNPSGKLPVTIPASKADAVPPCTMNPCYYVEELRGGWHVYDGEFRQRVVDFPFGHGLSYTTFTYSIVRVWNTALPRVLVLRVENTGTKAGREVVQLYVGFPAHEVVPRDLGVKPMPNYVLRGFKKTPLLQPGESCELRLTLTKRDLSVWDEASRSWRIATGRFDTIVGSSSRDKRLCGYFNYYVAARGDVGPMSACGG